MMNAKQLGLASCGFGLFVAAPVGFYLLSDAPFRSLVKDTLSFFTILAFAMMIAQFYLARSNKMLLQTFKPVMVQKFHKWLAYSAITVILLHPIFIVLPRYFEGGIAPWTALVTILSNFTNTGVLMGIVAWLMLVGVGLTAFFRRPIIKRVEGRYRGWRGLHAVLVLGFMLPALWHVTDLGRHVGWGLALYFCALLAVGLILLARLYPQTGPAKLFNTSKDTSR